MPEMRRYCTWQSKPCPEVINAVPEQAGRRHRTVHLQVSSRDYRYVNERMRALPVPLYSSIVQIQLDPGLFIVVKMMKKPEFTQMPSV
jgi:hypothetical protein